MPKRQEFTVALKNAMKNKDMVAVSTIRLIMAALKDRDVAARGKGENEGVGEEEILNMMQTMLKQRRESIDIYQKSGRDDLVEREKAEVEVIKEFLPDPLDGEELEEVIELLIAKSGAESIKDMGKVMAALKEGYAGRVDVSKAGVLVRGKL